MFRNTHYLFASAQAIPCRWLSITLIGLSLFCGAAIANAQGNWCPNEIGYERWLPSSGQNGYFTNKTFSQVYANYATQLVGPGLTQPPQKDKRLIDVEVKYDEKAGQPLVSGVWIESVGCDRKSSYLIAGVQSSELKPLIEYLKLAEYIVVDIERYQRKPNETQVFAMIVEPNKPGLDWDVLTGVELHYLEYGSLPFPYGYRVLEFDYLGPGSADTGGGRGPLGQADPYAFDFVIVQNPYGSIDYVQFDIGLYERSKLNDMVDTPFLCITDAELRDDDYVFALVVTRNYGYPSFLRVNQESWQIAAAAYDFGQVTDIEQSPFASFGWQSVHFDEPD